MATKTPPERIQKALAKAGLGSRREIETWISSGRVFVNGKQAVLGDRVSFGDRIKVDKRQITLAKMTPTCTKIFAYYKPVGEVSTRKDPEGRKTVFDSLPRLSKGRWVAIGRLDITTMGLLLFTDNGELANRMMHPSGNVEREYAVRVLGKANNQQIQNMVDGVKLEDGLAKFTDIVDSGGKGANHWYHVVLMEGRNREVRRLWESQGMAVSRLIRVRFGNYILPRKKRPGDHWELKESEVTDFLKQADLDK